MLRKAQTGVIYSPAADRPQGPGLEDEPVELLVEGRFAIVPESLLDDRIGDAVRPHVRPSSPRG